MHRVIVLLASILLSDAATIGKSDEVSLTSNNALHNQYAEEEITIAPDFPRTSSGIDVVHPETGFNVVICPLVKNITVDSLGHECPRGFTNAPACDKPDVTEIRKCKWTEHFVKKNAFPPPYQHPGLNCNQRFLTCLGDRFVIPGTTAVLDLSKNQLFDSSELAEVFTHLSDLFYVDLSENNLHKLHPMTFSKNPKLEFFAANLNFLSYLSENIFNDITALKYLALSGNRLSILPPLLFSKNTELEYVEIEGNNIKIVAPELFVNNRKLNAVLLTWNKIEQIPAGFFRNNPNLRKVNLAENSIAKIPHDLFDKARDIEEIYMSYNKLTRIPTNLLKNLRELRVLKLDRNEITYLPNNFLVQNRKLEVLDISYNRIFKVNPLLTRKNSLLTVFNEHREGGFWDGHVGVFDDRRFYSSEIATGKDDNTVTVIPKMASMVSDRNKKNKNKKIKNKKNRSSKNQQQQPPPINVFLGR